MACFKNNKIMDGIVLLTHQPLSSAMVTTAEHIYSKKLEMLYPMDIDPYIPAPHYLKILEDYAAHLPSNAQLLILNDICGASPYIIAQSFIHQTMQNQPNLRVALCTGMNLQVLIKAVCYYNSDLSTVLDKITQSSLQCHVKLHT